jgi:hypothetical protein
MKTRHEVRMRKDIGATDGTQSYHADSGPNSSLVLAVTLLAEIEDVLAVMRTVILAGRSFKLETTVEFPEEDAIRIAPNKMMSRASLANLLSSTQAKLCRKGSSASFALEATITTASFLTAGSFLVRIHRIETAPKRGS